MSLPYLAVKHDAGARLYAQIPMASFQQIIRGDNSNYMKMQVNDLITDKANLILTNA